MSIRHGGSRPLRCAGGVIRGVINNTGGSRRWLVTVTVHLTPARLVVRKSVDDTLTRTALHARCTIVVPSATIRVQK